MKKGWDEFTLGWLGRVFLTEFEHDLVETAFPVGALLAWNARLPRHNVRGAVAAGDGAGVEAKGMVATPCLAFLVILID